MYFDAVLLVRRRMLQLKTRIMKNRRNITLFCLRKPQAGDPMFKIFMYICERKGLLDVLWFKLKERCKRAQGNESRGEFKGAKFRRYDQTESLMLALVTFNNLLPCVYYVCLALVLHLAFLFIFLKSLKEIRKG